MQRFTDPRFLRKSPDWHKYLVRGLRILFGRGSQTMLRKIERVETGVDKFTPVISVVVEKRISDVVIEMPGLKTFDRFETGGIEVDGIGVLGPFPFGETSSPLDRPHTG